MKFKVIKGDDSPSIALRAAPQIKLIRPIKAPSGRIDLLAKLAELVQLGLQDKQELLDLLKPLAQRDLLALLD